MSQVFLNTSHFCDYHHEGEGEFAHWEEQWSFSMDGASLTQHKGWTGPEHYTGQTPLQPGDVIYVIVAVWSEGDSFGNADCRGWDACVINRDLGNAQTNLAVLQNATDQSGPTHLHLDTGDVIQYSPRWLNYFETLDSLEIKEFTL